MRRYGNSKVAKGVYRRLSEKLDAGDEILASLAEKLAKLNSEQVLEKPYLTTMKSYKDKLRALANKVDRIRSDVSKENSHLGDLLEAWSKIKASIDRMSRRVEKFEIKLIENKSIPSGVSEAAE